MLIFMKYWCFFDFLVKKCIFRPPAGTYALANGLIGVLGGPNWWNPWFYGFSPRFGDFLTFSGKLPKMLTFTKSGPQKPLWNRWLEQGLQPGAGKVHFFSQKEENPLNLVEYWYFLILGENAHFRPRGWKPCFFLWFNWCFWRPQLVKSTFSVSSGDFATF